MAPPPVTRQRSARRPLLLAAGVLAILLLAVAAAPLWLAGPRLGRLVERNLPRTRGHVHVGGGSWGWGTVWALLRHRPAALTFDDVSLTDPDGVLVFRARRVSGALVRGHAPDGVTIHELRVEDGLWHMAAMADRHGIGFLRALELAPPSGGPGGPARAAQPAGGPRYVRVERAELSDLDVDFDLPGWTLSLRRLHGHGSLGLERKDRGPDLFTFAVLDAVPRDGGRLSVLDGRWRSSLPFSSADIGRIAATAAAPDTIVLEASQIATGRSRTDVHGAFSGVLPAPGPPRRAGIDLAFTMRDAADAATAIATGHGWTPRLAIAGDQATLAMSFAGSLSAPRLDVQAVGFDVRYGGAAARACRLELEARLASRQLDLRELSFTSPGGGRLLANGHLDHQRAAGTLALERFDGSPYLPGGLRQVAAGIWTGGIDAHVDLAAGTAALDRVALTLLRPPGAGLPTAVHALTPGQPVPPRTAGDSVLRLGQARLQGGTLALPRVTAPLAGGQVTAAGAIQLWDPAARAWLASPSFDLSLDAARVSADQLLGTRLVSGQLSLRARARGTFDAVTLQVRVPAGQRVRILGEPLDLPRTLTLSLAGGTITLAPFRLSGPAGDTVAAEGTVTTDGRLALKTRMTGLPLRPLIASAAGVAPQDVPIEGRVGAQLTLHGDLAAPAIAGTLTLDRAQLWGRPVVGGVLALSTGPRGELRAHGSLVDGMPLDATVQLGAPGPRIAATLTLAHVALDPFLATVFAPVLAPVLASVFAPSAARSPSASLTGQTSGVVALALSPGAKPKLEANLSQLTISAHTAGRATAVTLQTIGPAHAVARPGEAHLEPVRLTGPGTDLQLSGDWRGDKATFHAQGTLGAATLAPLVAPVLVPVLAPALVPVLAPALVPGLAPVPAEATPWLDGALALNVQVSLQKGADPAATGSVAIATPVRARLAGLPFDLVATSGRVVLGDQSARVDDLSFEVEGSRVQAGGRLTLDGLGLPTAALAFQGTLRASLFEAFAHGYLSDGQGQVRVTGRLDGPLARPAMHARADVGGLAFTLMPGANRVRFASGQILIAGSPSTPTFALSNVDLHIGDGNQVVIGGAPHDPGRLRLAGGGSLGALDVDLPAQGRVRSLATPVAIIDAATFGLRLTGVPGRSLRLAGDILIDEAHVPPALRRPKKPAPAAPGDTTRAALNATRLDVRIRSKPRAVTVEVAHVPDLHAALDYHLGGTVGAPAAKGSVKPAGVYSAVLFFLARLLD